MKFISMPKRNSYMELIKPIRTSSHGLANRMQSPSEDAASLRLEEVMDFT